MRKAHGFLAAAAAVVMAVAIAFFGKFPEDAESVPFTDAARAETAMARGAHGHSNGVAPLEGQRREELARSNLSVQIFDSFGPSTRGGRLAVVVERSGVYQSEMWTVVHGRSDGTRLGDGDKPQVGDLMYFMRFTDNFGSSWGVASGAAARMESGGNDHTLLLDDRLNWPLIICVGGRELAPGSEYYAKSYEIGEGDRTPAPKMSVELLERRIYPVDGRPIYPRPAADSLLVIGADGCEPFVYRWSRREQLGHVLNLAPASSIVFEMLGSSLGSEVQISLRNVQGWRVSDSLEPLGSRSTEVPVPAGDVSFTVISKSDDALRPLLAGQLFLESGQSRTVSVDLSPRLATLQLNHEGGGWGASFNLRMFNPYGLRPLSVPIVGEPLGVGFHLWRNLSPGAYIASDGGWRHWVIDVEPGPNMKDLVTAATMPRYLHIVGDGDLELIPDWVSYARISGVPPEWPSFWPVSHGQGGVSVDGFPVIDVDAGDLEVMFMLGGVAYRESVKVNAGDHSIYIDAVPPLQVVLSDGVRPYLSWVEGVQFESAGAAIGEGDYRARTVGGRVQSVVVLAGQPDRLFVPSVDAAGWAGGWIDVPRRKGAKFVIGKGSAEWIY